MGFETGRQYPCKTYVVISPLVVEFDTEEAHRAFMEASG